MVHKEQVSGGVQSDLDIQNRQLARQPFQNIQYIAYLRVEVVQLPLLVKERLLHVLGDALLPVLPEHRQDGQALPVRDVSVPDYLGRKGFITK